MKKKIVAMALASVMCLGTLAGCGGSGASSASGASAPAADESYNISVIVKLTDGHFNKVMAGARAFDEEHDDVTIEILSPSSATAFDEQMNMIETALSQNDIDAVVISPLQSTTAGSMVDSNAGDKVIVALDTDFTSAKKSAFVGTGNKDAARSGADAAIAAAKAMGIETPTVAILTGVEGDETHDARLAGYTEGVEADGGKLIDVQYCDALADRAANAMEAIILNNPEGVDIILSTNDDMAMAAAKIIADSGVAAYADTVVCGFDGNQVALEAVKNGSLGMDVAQEGFDMGYKAVEAAYKVLKGESVDSFIDSGSTVVDLAGVDAYIADMQAKGLWEE